MPRIPSHHEPDGGGATVVEQMRAGTPAPIPVQPLRPESFDVPRVWSMLRNEPVDDGQALAVQINEFRGLANLMEAQHRQLLKLSGDLQRHWNPRGSAVAETFQSVFRLFIDSIARDANAYGSTCQALDHIMGTLREAKTRLQPTKRTWDQLTTRLPQEDWDPVARELNDQARRVLAEIDTAIGAIRLGIVAPPRYTPPEVAIDGFGPATTADDRMTTHGPAAPGGTTGTPGSSSGGLSGGSAGGLPSAGAVGSWQPVPAMPGFDPIDRNAPGLQGLPGQPALPGLPYLPQPVAVTPGSPISALPVPPGNPYAPGGGAYILPGPGVGGSGRIYPMPPPPGRPAGHVGSAGAVASGAGQTVTSLPSSGAGAGVAGSAERRSGRYRVTWEVARGVPPVIEVGSARRSSPDHTTPPESPDDVFANWFAEVANPWDNEMQADLVLLDVEPLEQTPAGSEHDPLKGSGSGPANHPPIWKDRTAHDSQR